MPLNLTRVESLIYEVLSDGEPHSPEDLMLSYTDQYGGRESVRTHISNLRKKLEPYSKVVVCCVRHRRSYYRMLRLLHSD